MKTKKAILIPLVILLGIFIGFQYERKVSTVYMETAEQESFKLKEIHTPKYLSEQLINYKKEHIENRKEPTNENEEIVAYFEDFHADKYDRNLETYEENGTVYTNLNGKRKTIASHGEKYNSITMMPKLSTSKHFISYTLCSDKNSSCRMVIKNLLSDDEIVLDDAQSVVWHPWKDLLLYDVAKSTDGHNLSESEIYLYDAHGNMQIQLTDSTKFIETNPIFSKDGDSVYCDDAKTDRLVYFPLFGTGKKQFISTVKFYKTPNNLLEVEEIKKRSNLFMPINKNEKFCDKNMTYWIELELNKDIESGIYKTNTHPFVFDKNSFTPEQLKIEEKSTSGVYIEDKRYATSFNYKAGVDESHYYFRLKSYTILSPFKHGLYQSLSVESQFYEPSYPQIYRHTKTSLIYTILSAIVIGMILMSALYTAVIYVYRRKKEFIYYTLMQVSMSLMLLTTFRGVFFSNNYAGEFSLLIAFFATLFTKSFLETKKYLPKLDMILNLYLVLIVADMIWIFDPMMMKNGLYEIFGVLYLVIAVIRIKDGFKPAWFYLFGWIGLLSSIALMDYFHFSSFTMFVGVFIEAVMLAWGLVYISGFGNKESLK